MKIAKYNSIDNWVESFLNNDFVSFMGSDSIANVPKVNVKETEKGFTLELAAPGLEKEDFNLELDNNVLTITASKEVKEEKTDERYTRKEYNFQSFRRAFSLPHQVDPDKISATYRNGVLYLELPKTGESAKLVKKIDIV